MDRTMPEYLATVRRADGRKVTENVVADSADEAVRLLRDRGYDEVVLHNDDIMALFTHQREKAEHLSPGDYLLLRNLPRGVGLFVVMTLQGYRKMWGVMVAMAFTLAYLHYTGRPSAILGLGLRGVPAVSFGVRGPRRNPPRAALGRRYEPMRWTHSIWGRWGRVPLEGRPGRTPGCAADEIAFRKAQAARPAWTGSIQALRILV